MYIMLLILDNCSDTVVFPKGKQTEETETKLMMLIKGYRRQKTGKSKSRIMEAADEIVTCGELRHGMGVNFVIVSTFPSEFWSPEQVGCRPTIMVCYLPLTAPPPVTGPRGAGSNREQQAKTTDANDRLYFEQRRILLRETMTDTTPTVFMMRY